VYAANGDQVKISKLDLSVIYYQQEEGLNDSAKDSKDKEEKNAKKKKNKNAGKDDASNQVINSV